MAEKHRSERWGLVQAKIARLGDVAERHSVVYVIMGVSMQCCEGSGKCRVGERGMVFDLEEGSRIDVLYAAIAVGLRKWGTVVVSLFARIKSECKVMFGRVRVSRCGVPCERFAMSLVFEVFKSCDKNV